jgi:hypothetical protein
MPTLARPRPFKEQQLDFRKGNLFTNNHAFITIGCAPIESQGDTTVQSASTN